MAARRRAALAGLGVAVLAALPGGARAGTDWNRPELATELFFDWALSTRDAETQQAEWRLDPRIDWQGPFDIALTAIGRVRADIRDELEPGQPSQATRSDANRRGFVSDRVDAELRELYLDGSVGPVSMRAGKQQVVWGKADGLKVLDVVNPQSFREFILDDFEDSRIPLWLLNAEWAIGDALLQLLWIPDKTYHELPEARALWAFTAPRFRPSPPPGVGLVVEDPERPSRFFEDSDAGVRLSAFVGGFDLTLNYLYLYDDIPVPFRRLELTPMGPRVVVTPGYERTHLVGGTF
ncbi:MAG: hypothetical protein MJE66_22795, partial [Proteobacteria bacterium]|nr:hypothetical protein [Pseudomonadota bacterium]